MVGDGHGGTAFLGEKPKYNYSAPRALAAVRNPDRLNFIPPWDVRPAREVAGCFHYRAWSVLIERRVVKYNAEELRHEAISFCYVMQRRFCKGTHPITPATAIEAFETPAVLAFDQQALLRWRALRILVEVLGGEMPPSELRKLLAFYVQPKPAEPPNAQNPS